MFRSKKKKLADLRQEVLSVIRGELLSFETMVQRAQRVGEDVDAGFVKEVRERLDVIHERAKAENNEKELKLLGEDAQQQGQLRAYVCPIGEIESEGTLAIDVMSEWGVPKNVVATLRDFLGTKLSGAATSPSAARGALRAIYEERDSWDDYTNEYTETMGSVTRKLFVATVVMLVLSLVLLQFPPMFVYAILLAGAVGGCISVMARMPILHVGLSSELASYSRRILKRVGTGAIGSLIGCALLGWGLVPLSIQGQTFADVMNSCSGADVTTCTGIKTLIVVAVPILCGFSERLIVSLEQKVFGKGG